MKRVVSLLFVLIFFIVNSSNVWADSQINTPWETASPWAREEIKRTVDMGFVPESLQQDYQQNITRIEFVEVLLDFLNYTFEDMLYKAYSMSSEKTGLPNIYQRINVFSDTDKPRVNLAYGLGIISGRQDGTFDPDGLITREEAAIMLQNTYKVYGDIQTHNDRTNFNDTFIDFELIAPWAVDSVYMMWYYGIMQGVEKDKFEPLGFYTREQCYTTFLRLYDEMPVSRAKGNVKQLITYDIAYEWVKSGSDALGYFNDSRYSANVEYEMQTPEFTLMYVFVGGLSQQLSTLYIIYPTGVFRHYYNFPSKTSNIDTDTFILSEDKTKLYFSYPNYSPEQYEFDLLEDEYLKLSRD